MEPTTHTLTTPDGTVISYTVFEGADPAVVILHGLAGSSREHLPTARALGGRRVVLVDQRGHGRSTRTPSDLSREAFVSDVAAVIDAVAELGITAPVDLVGQSMGAHTAMLVAAAHPEKVRRLVLLECDEGSGSAEEHKDLGDWLRAWPVPFADREAALAHLGDGALAQAWTADLEQRPDGLYPRFHADVMVDTIRAVAVPRWEEWESVEAPTLAVYAKGGMFTEEQKQRFVSRGRNVTRVDLAEGTHDAHLDAFEEWIAVLSEFLAQRG
ncbi:alpha/beta hydrolase [Leucobacter coleopterorum]|uniref:Alpha/beta hydrolase n=1 Tax=Leucobacter coleopterorum TaxID=2714933 RepID=A0ABX6K2Z6_9MICO|nr:alpha/beta hydrolase [Leucobacter coleopterorum]QIM19545.1 alpha/beta hydrolase [Leucobacter coleopterorum]